MGFEEDFARCMSPLPTPAELPSTVSEIGEWIHQLYLAWEAAGGDEKMLMTTLVAAGAVTGIDTDALAALGGITVAVYAGACLSCLVTAAGSSIWNLIASNETSPLIRQELEQRATEQGIPQPGGEEGAAIASAEEASAQPSLEGTQTVEYLESNPESSEEEATQPSDEETQTPEYAEADTEETQTPEYAEAGMNEESATESSANA